MLSFILGSLRGMHETAKSFASAGSTDLVRISKRLLQRTNLALVGAFMKTSSTDVDIFGDIPSAKTESHILRLAGVTAGTTGDGKDVNCCLVEVTMPSVGSVSGTLRVHTESIALGIQLADDLAQCLSEGV